MATIEWSSPPYSGLTYINRSTSRASAKLDTDSNTPAMHEGWGVAKERRRGKYQRAFVGHVSRYQFQVRPAGTETGPWPAAFDMGINAFATLSAWPRCSSGVELTLSCSIVRLSDGIGVWQDRMSAGAVSPRNGGASHSLASAKHGQGMLTAHEHEVSFVSHVIIVAGTSRRALYPHASVKLRIMGARASTLDITLI